MTVKYLLNGKLAKYPKNKENKNEMIILAIISLTKRHDRVKCQMPSPNV